MLSTLEHSFIEEILAKPEDDGPSLIYADWLEEQGEFARSQFIRVQCALEQMEQSDPRRADLEEQERSLRENHLAEWSAAIAPHVTGLEFRRGVIDSISISLDKLNSVGEKILSKTPLRRVRLIEVAGSEAINKFRHLALAPVMRRIREFELCGQAFGQVAINSLARSPYLERLWGLGLGFTELQDESLKKIAESPAFGALLALQINDNPALSAVGLTALSESPHLTKLREVDLSGNGLTGLAVWPLFEGGGLSSLTWLGLRGNRLGDAGVAAFARLKLAQQIVEKHRKLDFRQNGIGPNGLAGLMEAPSIHLLESLELDGNTVGDEGCRVLAGCQQMTRLKTLSLRENRITEEGVRALCKAPFLGSLKLLDLSGQWITSESVQRLREASLEQDWRGRLEIRADSPLRNRAILSALRRPNVG